MPYICAVILSKGKQRFSGGALYAWPLRGLRFDHAQESAAMPPVGYRLRFNPRPQRYAKVGQGDILVLGPFFLGCFRLL